MLAMDTNKLVIRLEKLMTSLPVHDPVKRRAHEQAVVPWAPEDVVKLCPNCAKSFNLTRSEQKLFFTLQLKVSNRELFLQTQTPLSPLRKYYVQRLLSLRGL